MSRRLSYQITGDLDADWTTVYLHGALLGSVMFHRQRDQVPGQRQVMVDLPGCGRSRGVRWRSMTDAAHLVLDVIDEVSPDRPVDLVGVSLGGDLGIRVVSLGPQRIGAAVLSGMISRPQRPWGEVWPAWQQVPQLRRGLLEFFARHSDVPEELIAQVNREAETIRHGDYIRTLASVYRGMDLRSYAHARTPVLAVCGQTEHPVAHEAVIDLVRVSPTTVGICPRGVGHNWYIEDPQAFAETVRLWCHEQQVPDPSVRIH